MRHTPWSHGGFGDYSIPTARERDRCQSHRSRPDRVPSGTAAAIRPADRGSRPEAPRAASNGGDGAQMRCRQRGGTLVADGREPGPSASAVSCHREPTPSRLTPTRSRPSRMRRGGGHQQPNAARTTGRPGRRGFPLRPPAARHTPSAAWRPATPSHASFSPVDPGTVRMDSGKQLIRPPPAKASDAAPRADRGRAVPGAARRVVAPSMPRQRSSSHTP